MDRDRYQIVKQAFAQVSRVPPAEREEVLRRACGDDEELRREVEALLAHDLSAPDGILGDHEPAPKSGSRPRSSFAGDFAPGEILIGRYRIVALVGEGGMGQVYLADDLVLGQPVAVKFLPQHLAERTEGLERFRAEVRHAREVTHPNVARVHDIGEVDGRHFLTMEYVDGEDLGRLIKRIGRIPREKASQIAQQVCSALAEAHRKGVLHRDLKPANVMLDGNGHVRLTDFGLAVVEEECSRASLAGTPQYMAPEQLAGVPASIQSEVYSLGLLLYELYTGRRALRGRSLDELRREHEDGGPDPPSSHLADLDPTVDAVLRRCLARVPEERPRSVSEVARALPGGDPLAAAIAAGETPAPNVVADAEAGGALTVGRASALLVFGALSFVALVLARPRLGFAQDYGEPPAVLRERARELTAELTGEQSFAHEIHWYQADPRLAELGPTGDDAATTRWSALLHHSRFGPKPFVAREELSEYDPPPVPGSAHLVFDAEGKLLSWRYRVDDSGRPADDLPIPSQTIDWAPLLRRAGFDPDALDPTDPTCVVGRPTTERRAWKTAISGPDGEPLRIEAAGDQGKPVLFEVIRGEQPLGVPAPGPPLDVLFMLLTGAAAFVGWRNVRSGRADLRGALVVGTVYFFGHLVWTFGQPLPDDLLGFLHRLSIKVNGYLGSGVGATLFYLALEPLARKHWPHTLIAWNRLLAGRARDPRVGREVLVGIVAGPASMLFAMCASAVLASAGVDASGAAWEQAQGLEGPLQMLCNVAHAVSDTQFFGMLMVFLLVLLRTVPGLGWSANWIWVALTTALVSAWWGAAVAFVLVLMMLTLLTRVGFLSVLVSGFAATVCSLPLTLSPREWHFPSSLVVLATLAIAGGWAYRAAIGGPSRLVPAAP